MIEISYTVRAHIILVFTGIKGHKTIPSMPPPRPHPPLVRHDHYQVCTTELPKKYCSGSTDIICLA